MFVLQGAQEYGKAWYTMKLTSLIRDIHKERKISKLTLSNLFIGGERPMMPVTPLDTDRVIGIDNFGMSKEASIDLVSDYVYNNFCHIKEVGSFTFKPLVISIFDKKEIKRPVTLYVKKNDVSAKNMSVLADLLSELSRLYYTVTVELCDNFTFDQKRAHADHLITIDLMSSDKLAVLFTPRNTK